MDMGVLMFPNPVATVPMAQLVESLGFDSFVFADTQCLTPEVWSHLMLVATATERMQIGTGVTNPVSRDPAVTASANRVAVCVLAAVSWPASTPCGNCCSMLWAMSCWATWADSRCWMVQPTT